MKEQILSLLACISLLSASHVWGAAPLYSRLDPKCKECTLIDDALTAYASQQDSAKRMDSVMTIAGIIKGMKLKNFPREEQMRRIHFALHGCVEVLDDDFDSETVVRLIDLRAQSPRNFDYVFQRFPLSDQKRIAERMKAAKRDGIRPKAMLPEVKEVPQ